MNRRNLVVAGLAMQVVVPMAAALGLPFVVRLPLALLYVFGVPGFAVVGLLRLGEPATEAALSVVLSMILSIATAQGLVWSGHYSLAAALAVLGGMSTLGLVAQLRALTARPSHPAPLTTGPSTPLRHPRP